MKKLFLLLFLIPNLVMAETYNCQYKWDDKKYEVTFERKLVNMDSKTYTFFLYQQYDPLELNTTDSMEEILHEDDESLILGTIGKTNSRIFRMIWIDKQNNKFRMGSLKEPQDSFNENNSSEAIPLGIHGVADGICK